MQSAKKNLQKYDAKKIELILSPCDFSKLNADIFTSFAVIQHFPNRNYLDNFLRNINRSMIPKLILQIRYSEKTQFSGSCENQDAVMLSCRTNLKYLLKKLTNYSCIEESHIHAKSNYQYLYFTKKNN